MHSPTDLFSFIFWLTIRCLVLFPFVSSAKALSSLDYRARLDQSGPDTLDIVRNRVYACLMISYLTWKMVVNVMYIKHLLYY